MEYKEVGDLSPCQQMYLSEKTLFSFRNILLMEIMFINTA